MIDNTNIYVLIDPRTNEVRYIGKADNPLDRLKHHLTPKQLRKKTAKNSWLKNLLAHSAKPILQILEIVPMRNWEERERYWIAYYQKLGFRLTNGTEGGDGGAPSEEARRKISITLKGRKLPPEQRQKMSAAHKGRVFSEETRLKISTAHIGHEVSISTKEKISKANKGHVHTDEAKRLISQAGRGRRPANAYSKYLGVSFDKRRNHWVAYITIDRKNKFIGNFPTEIDAAKARDKIAQLFWGSKAILNFPASKQETYQALINLNQLNSIISKIRIEARIQSRKIFKSKNNSSQYLGVCYIKQRSKWSATIRVNGKVKFLGHFDDEILAAKAYDRIAKKLKRNDALLNFPDIKQEA